jgi:hypothetical protein
MVAYIIRVDVVVARKILRDCVLARNLDKPNSVSKINLRLPMFLGLEDRLSTSKAGASFFMKACMNQSKLREYCARLPRRIAMFVC